MLQCKLETRGLCYADCRLREHRSQYAAFFIEFATVTQHSDGMKQYLCPNIIPFITHPAYERLYHTRGGRGVLPYITYTGMCRPKGS